MFQIAQRFRFLLHPALLTGIGLAVAVSVTAQIPPAPPSLDSAPTAQANYAACQPPSPGEYLLLVISKTPESQEQVRRTVPPSATVSVCNYLNDVVTRVGGFTTAETANAWANYTRESLGLSTFVARPAETTVAQPSPAQVQPPLSPTSKPTATTLPQSSTSRPAAIRPSTLQKRAYNPQVLGTGYAVLVDYFNQPELATQVRQLVGKDIGLVSYRQRPYLLAVYTSDQSLANSTLQTLTDRGFWAMVVDGRRVTLLRQAIDLPQATGRN